MCNYAITIIVTNMALDERKEVKNFQTVETRINKCLVKFISHSPFPLIILFIKYCTDKTQFDRNRQDIVLQPIKLTKRVILIYTTHFLSILYQLDDH